MTAFALSGPRAAHDAAVDELRRARAGSGSVQLGKRTSNLFRFGDRDRAHGSATRLDTSALDGVIGVDPVARTAEVQGVATYETIVDATLRHGLMPLVVPQLKTITLGGAVTGLGIESSSFRHGLPHESVLEMDVLTPEGELVTARPDGEHADLFRTFPNSYGTLGYVVRLVIELMPVGRYVRLTHHRYPDAKAATDAIVDLADLGRPGHVEFLDGTVFSPTEQYLTVGEFVDEPMPGARVSDYTGQEVFYRSLQRRPVDHLTCARLHLALGPGLVLVLARVRRAAAAGAPVLAAPAAPLRRVPAPGRAGPALPGQQPRAEHIRPSQRGDGRAGRGDPGARGSRSSSRCSTARYGSLRCGCARSGCAGSGRGRCTRWSRASCTSTSASGRRSRNGPGSRSAHNRIVEELVADLGGHKSLYSTVHYGEDEFWARYNGAAYRAVKQRYDPAGRAPDLFTKVTRR